MKREKGYYWVRRGDSWEVAYWETDLSEWIIGDNYYPDNMREFCEIDERRLTRENPKEYIIDLGNDFISIT